MILGKFFCIFTYCCGQIENSNWVTSRLHKVIGFLNESMSIDFGGVNKALLILGPLSQVICDEAVWLILTYCDFLNNMCYMYHLLLILWCIYKHFWILQWSMSVQGFKVTSKHICNILVVFAEYFPVMSAYQILIAKFW